MSNDISQEEMLQLAEMLDRAITSKNPSVRRAVQNLMILTSMTDEHDYSSAQRAGPLSQRINDLENKCMRNEKELMQLTAELKRVINTIQKPADHYRHYNHYYTTTDVSKMYDVVKTDFLNGPSLFNKGTS